MIHVVGGEYIYIYIFFLERTKQLQSGESTFITIHQDCRGTGALYTLDNDVVDGPLRDDAIVRYRIARERVVTTFDCEKEKSPRGIGGRRCGNARGVSGVRTLRGRTVNPAGARGWFWEKCFADKLNDKGRKRAFGRV